MPSFKVASVMLALSLASSVIASPFEKLPILVARQDAGSCRNQSCEVATVSGSTGATSYNYPTYPVGDTQDGDCCIVRYFPASKDKFYQVRPGLQAYCASHGGDAPKDKNPPGVNVITKREEMEEAPLAEEVEKRATAACKPNILIFVKGTLEPGDTGITIGPSLAGGLNQTKWDVRGVNYDNSFANDYCLGLPGGINARQVLAQAVAQCPNSIIAMSGYSQGAMVVRHALARAAASDVAHVKNVVTFGDPFVGANIGQYNGPRHVFCMTNDGVCNGQLDISLAHLSYGVDVSQAVQILEATK